MRKLKLLLILLAAGACVQYTSPTRDTWPQYLNGASFTDMNEISRIAKRPVYLGAGGQLVQNIVN